MEISILLKRGYSHREIAFVLKKDHSSVSREIKRNMVLGIYDPSKASHKAYVVRRKSKYQAMKVVEKPWLEQYIRKKLQIFWTPEQIAGKLRRKFGKNIISPKSIYEYLYSSFGQRYCKYLPSKQYHARKRTAKIPLAPMIPNRVSINLRPEVINLRQRFGDFEADTLGRPENELITLTGIVERQSRYLLACKVPRPKYSMDGFKKLLNPYHRIAKSTTFDNGIENAKHEELQISTYFCDPYSSWQKGTVENTFLRLRRFIPKRSSLEKYTDQQISAIIDIMNNTPRKCLEFRTPKEVFNEQISLAIKQDKCCTSG